MTYGAIASYVNENFTAGVLYMIVNSHVICRIQSELYAVVENGMTMCPNEREVQFKFLTII